MFRNIYKSLILQHMSCNDEQKNKTFNTKIISPRKPMYLYLSVKFKFNHFTVIFLVISFSRVYLY